MDLRRDILLGVVVLATLHAVLSFGAIGLFSRMSPEIEHILQANVVSLEACENMLAAMAAAPGLPAEHSFEQALAAAQANITETTEKPLLKAISTRYREAIAGPGSARDEVLAAVLALGQVNRDAMRRSDEEAKRLGNAGSWAAVFLAMTSFIASVVVIRRMRRRVIVPFDRIHDTLVAARKGNLLRRCPTSGISYELAALGTEINGLLERLAQRTTPAAAARTKDSLNRAMLLHALDHIAGPAVYVNARGDMLASNRAAIELLSGVKAVAIVAALGKIGPAGPAIGDVVEYASRVGELDVWLCSLHGESS